MATVLAVAIAVFGCTRGEDGASTASAIRRSEPATVRSWAGCPSNGTRTARVQVVAELNPQDWPEGGASSPGRLLDIALGPAGRVFALDALLRRVFELSANLRVVRSWGTEGQGPGELWNPTAIAFDRESSELWITENAPNRLHRFSLEGQALGTRALRAPAATTLSTVGRGRLATSYPVFHDMVRRAGTRALVVVVDTTGMVVDSFDLIGRQDVGRFPFIESQLSQVRLFSTANHQVVVAHPAANAVTVLDTAGAVVTRTRGCLPAEAERWTRTGLSQGVPGRAVLFVSAVHVDPSGRVYVLNRWPDRDGWFYVDAFGRGGKPLEGLRFRGEGVRIHSLSLFDGGPLDIVSWWTDGHIVRLHLVLRDSQ